MTHGSEIRFFPVDSQLKETDKSFSVHINEQGIVDLANLPDKEQRTLESFGLPNEMGDGRLFPKDGERFLQALQRSTNGYRIFRSE